MDFEQRLRSHLDEQANAIEIETPDPSAIVTEPARTRSTVTALAALVVVIAGAAGFWLLSSGDPGPVTEIAAGEAEAAADGNDADQSEDNAQSDEGSAGVGRSGPLEFIDITSDNSPGFGRIVGDGGAYYVLSTAPGRVDVSEDLGDEQLMELFRQNTFYIYHQDDGWSVNKVEDRFISDFDAADGVLYAVSTGSKSGKPGAFGTSADRGRTWTWTDIAGLPQTDQLTMLRTGDRTVLFATRWGFPDHDEVIEVASDAGLPVTEFTLRDFDHRGFSYMEVDGNNRCAAIVAPYLEEVASFAAWIAEASEQERENAELEFESMAQWMNEELAGSGCELPEELDSIESLGTLDLPEPERITWAEIGFTPPESWQPWSTVYVHDGQQFVDVGLPFDTEETQLGYSSSDGDRLTIHVWETGPDADAEIRWRTTDGESWDREVIRHDEITEEQGYYDPYYPLPRAGDFTFRLWWDESLYEQESLYEDESLYEEDGATEAEYIEPAPLLQRSNAGGPYETVTLAELAPDVDVGDSVLYDVRGTAFGVFLLYGPQRGPATSSDDELVIVHSANGIDWDTVELTGQSIDISPLTSAGDGGSNDMLLFAHQYGMEPGQESSARAYLVRPAD